MDIVCRQRCPQLFQHVKYFNVSLQSGHGTSNLKLMNQVLLREYNLLWFWMNTMFSTCVELDALTGAGFLLDSRRVIKISHLLIA